MKGDFSRSTFRPDKHYSGVRMQQGRVQLDADWNEQLDIQAHRSETASADVIGLSGAPNDNPGFEITPGGDNIKIGQGRYYVDGILCENEKDVSFAEQPDLPGATLPTEDDAYLAYLDVWQRHITMLEDPSLREVALGGPDTATRTKTVWQVRLLPVDASDLSGEDLRVAQRLAGLISPETAVSYAGGHLQARSDPGEQGNQLYAVSAGGGYHGLENRLYRVEIHQGRIRGRTNGSGATPDCTFKWSRDNGSVVRKWKEQNGNILTIEGLRQDQTADFVSVGQWVELIDDDRELWGEPGILVQVKDVGERTITIGPVAEGKLLLSDTAAGGSQTSLALSSTTDIALPAFKVSVEGFTGAGIARVPQARVLAAEVPFTLAADGRFATVGTELNDLAQIATELEDGNTIEITGTLPNDDPVSAFFTYGSDNDGTAVQSLIDAINIAFNGQAVASLGGGTPQLADFDVNRSKIRRWDFTQPLEAMAVRVPVENDGWIELEDGVEIKFEEGKDYYTGDYWLIPARAVLADVEWPEDEDGNPASLPPHGIKHHYCCLGLVKYENDEFLNFGDWRRVFPALTDLNKLRYISGDGQEAMPGDELPQPLRVGVFIGRHPLEGAKVRFEIVGGGGILREVADANPQEDTTLTLSTDSSGIVPCSWELPSYYDAMADEQGALRTQLQVKATLFDDSSQPLDVPVIFSAAFSLAEQVAYQPGGRGADDPDQMGDTTTVQEGLDKLDDIKVNKYGVDTMQGSLTIDNGLTVNADLIVRGDMEIKGDVIAKDKEHVAGSMQLGDHPDDTIEFHGILSAPHQDALLVGDALHVTESLTVAGNVGIGTTEPDATLEIKADQPDLTLRRSNNNNRARILFRNSGGAYIANIHTTRPTDGDLVFRVGPHNLEPDDLPGVLTIKNEGNVGIGTTTPVEKLTVAGNQPRFMLEHTDTLIGVEGGTTAFGVIMARDNQSTSPQAYISLAREGVSSDANDLPTTIRFATTADGSNQSLERMIIDNAGNVGIGTTEPEARLQIRGHNNPIPLRVGHQSGGNEFTMDIAAGEGLVSLVAGALIRPGGSKYDFLGSRGASRIILHDGNIRFCTSDSGSGTAGNEATGLSFNNAKMVLTNTGNVGIGTTEPVSKLHVVNGAIETNDQYRLSGFTLAFRHGPTAQVRIGGGTGGLALLDSGGNARVVMENSGNVGIGTAEPGSKLTVDGVIESKSGGFKFPDGTIQFSAGEEGLWRRSEEDIYYDAGNVGIGTDTPTAPLTIKTISGADVFFTGGGEGYNADIHSEREFRIGTINSSPLSLITDNQFRLTIAGNGDVGIGTTSPGGKLHVQGSIIGEGISVAPTNTTRGALWLATYGDFNHVLYNNYSNVDGEGTWDGHKWNTYAGLNIRIGAGGSKKSALFIEGPTSGNVGIGTEAPLQKLVVSDGKASIGYNDAAQTAALAVDGNVGLGTTEPTEKLSVTGNIDMTGLNRRLYMGGVGRTTFGIASDKYRPNHGIFYTEGYHDFVSISPNGDPKNGVMNIYGNGKVGIGISPEDKLDVQGNIRSRGHIIVHRNISCEGRIGADEIYSSGKLTVYSDIEYTGKLRPIFPGGGEDYAEYFESSDGKEIPIGVSVVLAGNKIRAAKRDNIPIGVISANPAIVGGMPLEWPEKYLRDQYGNLIMEEYEEEVMVPKKEKVTRERQKVEQKKIEEEVTRMEVIKKGRKYIQQEITGTVPREVEEPVFKEVNLYDEKGKNIIGKHRIPVMETYEEEVDVRDENGEPVMVGTGELITKERPKLNPDWDESKEYISREDRPEWNCVGILGKLRLRKGQQVAPTWVKIKDISEEVELWLVK